MKKLLLILLLLISISCKAQKVEPVKLFSVDLTVLYVENGNVGLINQLFGKNFKADATGLEVEIGWEYTFVLEMLDCDKCDTRIVRVVSYSISPLQADKNVKKMLKELGLNYR
jgi:hypothetical protein